MRNTEKETISLDYGTSELSVRVRDDVVSLGHQEPLDLVDPQKFKDNLLIILKKMEKPFQNVGIVVSDKTRLCQYPEFLPFLTSGLEEYGISREDITFYIAYGTHLPQTEEESYQSYGETYKQFRFIHHNSKAEDELLSLGITRRGTRVMILKDILHYDLLISFGAILHHYFAGFGGGRKLLFPGLAGYDSILYNHQLFLDYEKKELRQGCQSGNLDSNPLALDLEEINYMLPKRLEIHAILNSHKEVSEVRIGFNYNDFRKSCADYDRYFRNRDARVYDLVVAGAGGYPKDINFIQAHKAIHNAASFVKEKGTLIIFTECIDGIGNQSLLELFRLGGSNQIFEKMASSYENNAGTVLAMMDKTQRINIHLITSMDQETCYQMGAVKSTLEKAQQLIDDEPGSIAWIENASLLYK